MLSNLFKFHWDYKQKSSMQIIIIINWWFFRFVFDRRRDDKQIISEILDIVNLMRCFGESTEFHFPKNLNYHKRGFWSMLAWHRFQGASRKENIALNPWIQACLMKCNIDLHNTRILEWKSWDWSWLFYYQNLPRYRISIDFFYYRIAWTVLLTWN